jgi:hypothetical protein
MFRHNRNRRWRRANRARPAARPAKPSRHKISRRRTRQHRQFPRQHRTVRPRPAARSLRIRPRRSRQPPRASAQRRQGRPLQPARRPKSAPRGPTTRPLEARSRSIARGLHSARRVALSGHQQSPRLPLRPPHLRQVPPDNSRSPVHGEFVITPRSASGTDRGNGTAKRIGQGWHGRGLVQLGYLDCSNGRITRINMLVVRLPARTRIVPVRKLFAIE